MLLYKSDLERRIRELAVKRSEAEYRIAERLGRVGHWRFDLRTRKLECSAELLSICGLPKDASPSHRTILSLHHPNDAAVQRACTWTALCEGTGWDGTRRITRPDGRIRVIRSHEEVETNEYGQTVSIFGVFVDITELERSRQQAEAATAAKAEFLANMSHEIRTPLNSIIGFTDLMLDDDGIAPVHRRQLELVRNSGGALLTVVNDILDFSKIEAGKVELVARSFDLAYLVQNTVAIIRQSAQTKGLRIDVVVDPALHRNFLADDRRLQQILLNLLSNAVKFTEAGGIALTVRKVSPTDGRQMISFVVTDSGIGIAPSQAHRLFQQFSQTNPTISRQYGGTGLGLAICKRLVTLMGGEIGFRPCPDGGGSQFWFDVSLEPTDEPLPRRSKSPLKALHSQLSILVVEDVAVNQELAEAVLARLGHRVEIASNGREAIAAVQEQDFDLVLMDLQMPIMDGITATKIIRLLPGRGRTVPIIALTANILPEQVETFRQAGMNGHVGKPITMRNWSTLSLALSPGQNQARRLLGKVIETHAGFNEAAYLQLAATLPADRLIVHSQVFRAAMDELCRFDVSAKKLKSTAHSVISQAGMFGFMALSALCRALEDALENDQSVDHLAKDIRSAVKLARVQLDHLQLDERRLIA